MTLGGKKKVNEERKWVECRRKWLSTALPAKKWHQLTSGAGKHAASTATAFKRMVSSHQRNQSALIKTNLFTALLVSISKGCWAQWDRNPCMKYGPIKRLFHMHTLTSTWKAEYLTLECQNLQYLNGPAGQTKIPVNPSLCLCCCSHEEITLWSPPVWDTCEQIHKASVWGLFLPALIRILEIKKKKRRKKKEKNNSGSVLIFQREPKQAGECF